MVAGGVANDAPTAREEKASAVAAVRIKEEAQEVRQLQDWWSDETGQAPAAAVRRPVLACLEERVLAEVVAAGGNYHTVLSADRLDGLHRQYGTSADASLEPLRKALQARGGAKAQARAVGSLLFKEARALHEQCLHDGAFAKSLVATVATPSRAGAAVPQSAASPRPVAVASAAAASPGGEVRLDEAFVVPRRYRCSEAYPPGAQMAARSAPSSGSEMVARLPADFAYSATGRTGDWLQVPVQVEQKGCVSTAYVLHTIDGKVMLEPVEEVRAQPPEAEVHQLQVWSPAQRWVRAEGYPAGAMMAARAAPSREGKQVATLPPDFDYHPVTGRSGDYLQIHLDIDGTSAAAYVLHTLRGPKEGDLVLLRPASAPQPEQQLELYQQPQQHQQQTALAQLASPPSLAATPAPLVVQQPEAHGAVATLQQLQQLQQSAQAQLQVQQQRAADAAAAARAAAEAATSAAAAARTTSDVRVEALEAKVVLQERQIQALQSELQQLKAALGTAASVLAAAALSS